ncbi:MAG: cysteine desulfurase NifS [Candidatus Omnitrophica bacterium CG11_big_fil_rev_8_21_14_0_20_63_9]|nr:MAG: cysteine desulfurase NifS [Candidatus Omnitrophica bacterium CG11_big_fil_rev_8_21_14_0_20_63_9]
MRIYLDYVSSTPVLPEVRAAMAEALEKGANPSSIHQAGQKARERLEKARKQVAALIHAKPAEIYFTSCGTESNNWALRGLMAANKRKGNHISVSAIEHPSVSLVARRLELEGAAKVTILPVDGDGIVSAQALKQLLTPQTVLVSVMLANGEVGTIEPIKEMAAIAHEQGALFHTDAIATVGHNPVDVKALGVDALSMSANQFYGPPGAAALFVRDGVRILPLLEGGGQETGARSGTEALPAIVGMGAAAEIAKRELPSRMARLSMLRDRLRDGLKERIEGLRLNGSWSSRLPHNLHICIDGVSSESLVLGLDQAGIAAGLGSACNSKSMRPSHVLKAMGLTDEQAKGALVLSLGEQTTEKEIDRALELIPSVVQKLRNVTALTAR